MDKKVGILSSTVVLLDKIGVFVPGIGPLLKLKDKGCKSFDVSFVVMFPSCYRDAYLLINHKLMCMGWKDLLTARQFCTNCC